MEFHVKSRLPPFSLEQTTAGSAVRILSGDLFYYTDTNGINTEGNMSI